LFVKSRYDNKKSYNLRRGINLHPSSLFLLKCGCTPHQKEFKGKMVSPFSSLFL
jgi:hypothetical protein